MCGFSPGEMSESRLSMVVDAIQKKKFALLPWTDQGREGLKWLVEEGG